MRPPRGCRRPAQTPSLDDVNLAMDWSRGGRAVGKWGKGVGCQMLQPRFYRVSDEAPVSCASTVESGLSWQGSLAASTPIPSLSPPRAPSKKNRPTQKNKVAANPFSVVNIPPPPRHRRIDFQCWVQNPPQRWGLALLRRDLAVASRQGRSAGFLKGRSKRHKEAWREKFLGIRGEERGRG